MVTCRKRKRWVYGEKDGEKKTNKFSLNQVEDNWEKNFHEKNKTKVNLSWKRVKCWSLLTDVDTLEPTMLLLTSRPTLK